MKISPRVADIYTGWAEEFYNPELSYHNWGHAEEVMTESLQLLNEGGRWTRHVNRPLLQIGAGWHNAGYDHDERFNFESAEHYSVHLMRQRLRGALPERQLRELEESILGTHYQAARNSMAAIALHYGDVGNMAHPYESFRDHTVRLWAEHGNPQWSEWRTQTLGVIATTADEALADLPRIGVPVEPFAENISRNASRLWLEQEPAI